MYATQGPRTDQANSLLQRGPFPPPSQLTMAPAREAAAVVLSCLIQQLPVTKQRDRAVCGDLDDQAELGSRTRRSAASAPSLATHDLRIKDYPTCVEHHAVLADRCKAIR